MPVHHRLQLLAFPMRTRSAYCLWTGTRAPRFRRDPCARDVALDPGGTTMPRITALLMLRSTMKTVSAPASRSFRGSIPHPTQPLCTLRVRRHRRLTQHSLPGGLLGLTWAGLAPADRASLAWRLPSFDHLVRASEQLFGGSMPTAFAVFMLITSSNFVDCNTGRSAGFVPFAMLRGIEFPLAGTYPQEGSRRSSVHPASANSRWAAIAGKRLCIARVAICRDGYEKIRRRR